MHFFIGFFFALLCVYLLVGLIGWKGIGYLLTTIAIVFLLGLMFIWNNMQKEQAARQIEEQQRQVHYAQIRKDRAELKLCVAQNKNWYIEFERNYPSRAIFQDYPEDDPCLELHKRVAATQYEIP